MNHRFEFCEFKFTKLITISYNLNHTSFKGEKKIYFN